MKTSIVKKQEEKESSCLWQETLRVFEVHQCFTELTLDRDLIMVLCSLNFNNYHVWYENFLELNPCLFIPQSFTFTSFIE